MKADIKSVPTADDFPQRIPPGDYQAICVKTEVGISWGGRRKIFLRFRIHGDQRDGTDLFMACPFPKGKLSLQCKYYKQWMLANGSPPKPGQKLARKIFPNRLYRVRVRNSTRRHDNGELLPEFMQYSVVDTILEPLTGGAPE